MTGPDIVRAPDRLRPAYRFYRWAWTGLDLLYPPHCGGCGTAGARWCVSCQANTLSVSPPVCERCGQRLANGRLCQECLVSPPAYLALRSWAVFEGPLRQALHRLKYAGDMALGEILARPLIKLFMETNWPVNLVTPVPMGIVRRAERGYNQAALLAWPLALSCNLAYRPKALSKIRETRSQVGLNRDERRNNVLGAFRADPDLVLHRTVLIVDDVTTSGATMQTCAGALLAAGAEQVYGLTLARAFHIPEPKQSLG